MLDHLIIFRSEIFSFKEFLITFDCHYFEFSFEINEIKKDVIDFEFIYSVKLGILSNKSVPRRLI